MNKIYAIRNEGFNFQEFDLDVDDFIDLAPEQYDDLVIHNFSYHNLALLPWWKPISSGFRQITGVPASPIPDIGCWNDATLILSPGAYEALFSSLRDFGEFLPVSVNGDIYYIFNCLTFGKVDEANSEQEIIDGQVMSIKKLQFDMNDVQEKTAFKTKYNHCMNIFCDANLKQAVESHQLKGIIFSDHLVENFGQ